MKHKITTKQALSLPEKKRSKLQDWWQPQKGEWIVFINGNEAQIDRFNEKDNIIVYINRIGQVEAAHKKVALPLLTISQMIEFLEDSKQEKELVIQNISKDSSWMVDIGYNKVCFKKEFCDALWEAIREYLHLQTEA